MPALPAKPPAVCDYLLFTFYHLMIRYWLGGIGAVVGQLLPAFLFIIISWSMVDSPTAFAVLVALPDQPFDRIGKYMRIPTGAQIDELFGFR